MPKVKREFNAASIIRGIGFPFILLTRIPFVIYAIGTVCGLFGALMYSIAAEGNASNELRDGSSVQEYQRSYRLFNDTSVLVELGDFVYEYDFNARAMITYEHGDVKDRERFENLSPHHVMEAYDAAIIAATQLQTIFLDAPDRWLVNDDEQRQELMENARKFLEEFDNDEARARIEASLRRSDQNQRQQSEMTQVMN